MANSKSQIEYGCSIPIALVIDVLLLILLLKLVLGLLLLLPPPLLLPLLPFLLLLQFLSLLFLQFELQRRNRLVLDLKFALLFDEGLALGFAALGAGQNEEDADIREGQP
jgi:hypothetical protein